MKKLTLLATKKITFLRVLLTSKGKSIFTEEELEILKKVTGLVEEDFEEEAEELLKSINFGKLIRLLD